MKIIRFDQIPEQLYDGRFVRIEVSAEFIAALCISDEHHNFIVDRGLPESSRFMYGWFDQSSNIVNLIIRDDSFEKLTPGQDIPIFLPLFTTIHGDQ